MSSGGNEAIVSLSMNSRQADPHRQRGNSGESTWSKESRMSEFSFSLLKETGSPCLPSASEIRSPNAQTFDLTTDQNVFSKQKHSMTCPKSRSQV